MPVSSNYCSDSQLSINTGRIRTNTNNRWIKDNITNNISAIATSTHPKIEISRTNSPTYKRLVAVKIKLDKYIASIPNTLSSSPQPTHEISNHEKQSTTNVRMPSSSAKNRIKSKSKSGTGPLGKTTYEKTWTHNGKLKQKCSLEIWLPKPDSDDEDGNTGRATSPDPNLIIKESQLMSTKSRRPSTTKLSTTENSEIKSFVDIFSKKTEPIIVPRVYHYEEYLTDQPEERPHSGKSGHTTKSNSSRLNNNVKHQHIRLHTRRLSPPTNNTEETVQSATSGLPMTSKNLLANIKRTYSDRETKGTSGSNNSSTINALMKKYSMIKKSHQELIQTKLQIENPHQDSKVNAHITKDRSLPSPPPSDTASYISSDHLTVSVRKLLGDISPPRSSGNSLNTSLNGADRRSSHHKSSYLDIYPQTRLFCVVNHLQYRQTSASMPTPLLPAAVRKKTNNLLRSFQRSKTLDVPFDIPIDNKNKIPSRLPARPESPRNLPSSSNILHRTTNGNGQVSPRISKRFLPPSSHPLRSEQQQQQISPPLVQLVQYQNIQNSAQRYHHSPHTSSSATDKVLVHLKYSNGGNTDRNCLIPE